MSILYKVRSVLGSGLSAPLKSGKSASAQILSAPLSCVAAVITGEKRVQNPSEELKQVMQSSCLPLNDKTWNLNASWRIAQIKLSLLQLRRLSIWWESAVLCCLHVLPTFYVSGIFRTGDVFGGGLSLSLPLSQLPRVTHKRWLQEISAGLSFYFYFFPPTAFGFVFTYFIP